MLKIYECARDFKDLKTSSYSWEYLSQQITKNLNLPHTQTIIIDYVVPMFRH